MLQRIPLFFRAAIAAALSASGPGFAAAVDPNTAMFSLDGFGTLGVVHSSEQQADFTNNQFKPNGAGYSRDWSASVDSLLAGQITANFTSKLSAVLQIMVEQNYDASYRPHVEWADIKYQFTPEFSARVGRTVLPSFLVSDARKLGYTNPWVRPPVEVYGLIPLTNSDGVDLGYRLQWGNFTHSLVGSYGATNPRIPGGAKVDARRGWLVADTIEHGPTTVHVAYEQTHLTIDSFAPLFDAFRQFGPQGSAIADKYDVTNKTVKFLGVGALYDPGNWFVTAEWGRIELNSLGGTRTGWYASSGYRLAKLTPFLTYGQGNADNLSDPGLTLAAYPVSLAGTAAGLNAALNSILSNKRVQSTVSIGGRWDFMKNADVKLQFDRTRIGAGSSGALINLQPAFRLGGELNLISISVDFVF